MEVVNRLLLYLKRTLGDPSSINMVNKVKAAEGQNGQTSSGRFDAEDFKAYSEKVKERLRNQPQIYNDFLDIIERHKSNRYNIFEIMNRVCNLLSDHPDLIVGFNPFLPSDTAFQISNASEYVNTKNWNKKNSSTQAGSSTETVKEEEEDFATEVAEAFLEKVRERLRHHQPHIFNDFLVLLTKFRREELTITRLMILVNILFRDHKDLIEGFNAFLPPDYIIFIEEPENTKISNQKHVGTQVEPELFSPQKIVNGGTLHMPECLKRLTTQ